MDKIKNKKLLIALVSVVIGMLLGLIIASNLNWTQNSLAGNNPSQLETAQSNSPNLINSDLEATSRGFVEIAKRIIPTVVSITSEKVVKVDGPFSNFFHNDEFFRRFFPDMGDGQQEFRQKGLGSGVIVSPDGYVLTNYHVVKEADELNVIIDKKQYDAKIIGTDPASDIAVIKIDANNLPAVVLGNSDKLEVGELVLAVGSPFDLRLEHTVTSGIISAKGRSLNLGGELTYQDFIQTDAAINPGNSGGALVNIRGELIGINTAIFAGNTGGNIGIGFAIPINLAKNVMNDLIKHGKVYRGYLGVYITTPDNELSEALKLKDAKGALINEVAKDTPADRAGLKKYDVIIEVDGKKIEDSQSLTNMIAGYSPGSSIHLKFIRDGKINETTIMLGERPDETSERSSLLRQQGTVLEKLGLELSDLTRRLRENYGYENEEGVLVTNVRGGSIAEEKGFRAGDLIKEIDRQKVTSVRELEVIIGKQKEGQIILFQMQRESRNFFVALRVPK